MKYTVSEIILKSGVQLEVKGTNEEVLAAVLGGRRNGDNNFVPFKVRSHMALDTLIITRNIDAREVISVGYQHEHNDEENKASSVPEYYDGNGGEVVLG